MAIELQVPSMVCGKCVETITKAIKTVDADATISTDLEKKTVTLESSATAESFKEAIINSGHTIA